MLTVGPSRACTCEICRRCICFAAYRAATHQSGGSTQGPMSSSIQLASPANRISPLPCFSRRRQDCTHGTPVQLHSEWADSTEKAGMEGQCETDGLSSQQVVLQHEARSSCTCSMQIAAHGDSQPAQPVSSAAPQRRSSAGSWDLWGSQGARMQTESRCHAHELARSGCLALHGESHLNTKFMEAVAIQTECKTLIWAYNGFNAESCHTNASKCERASIEWLQRAPITVLGKVFRAKNPMLLKVERFSRSRVKYLTSNSAMCFPPSLLHSYSRHQIAFHRRSRDQCATSCKMVSPLVHTWLAQNSCNRQDAFSGKKNKRTGAYHAMLT